MSAVDATDMTTKGKSSDDGDESATSTTATLQQKTRDSTSTTSTASPVRQWFTGLTVTEMNNVMSSSRYGNDDGHHKLLWEAMVQTARTTIGGGGGSSSSTDDTTREKKIGSNVDGRRTNDENWWETNVPVSTIERLWSRSGNRDDDDCGDRTTAPTSTMTTAGTVAGASRTIGGDGNKTPTNDYEDQEHPDTYRIRADTQSEQGKGENVVQQQQSQLGKDQEKSPSGEGDNYEKESVLLSSTSNEASPPSSSEAAEKALSPHKNHPSIRLLMENISVVLPKGSENVTSETTALSDGAQNFFITFNPSYLQTTSNHELVSSLDEITSAMKDTAPVVSSDFLGHDARAMGTFWEYVDAYISITADKDTQSTPTSTMGSSADRKLHFIPLYRLVVLHFEYSAYRTHNSSKTGEGSNDRLAATDGKNHSHSPVFSNELLSDDSVIIPLEKVTKKLFEQKNDDSPPFHDIALFLQSLVGDTRNGTIPEPETKAHDETPERAPDVAGPSTSLSPPLAVTLDVKKDASAPPNTDDVDKKTIEVDTVEAGQGLEIENPTNPSESPASKSKSGRKSSGKGGKKKKKKNKKKRSSSAAQEKLTLETSEGKTEQTEDELQELKSKPVDGDAVGNDISGIDKANIVEARRDEVGQGQSKDNIADVQKTAVEIVVEESASDETATNVEKKQSETLKTPEQAPATTLDTMKNPSPAEDSAPEPTPNTKEDNRRLPPTTTVTFDDSSTDSSNIMVHQSTYDNPAEVDEKAREEAHPGPAKNEENDESGDGPTSDPVTLDDGEWETVETRTRNTRKKKNSNDRNSQSGGRSGQGSSAEHGSGPRRKRDRDRKRAQNRRSAKENQSSELDSSADGGRRVRSESDAQSATAVPPSPSATTERPGSTMASRITSKVPSSSPVVRQNSTNNSSAGASGSTMRDVLLGKKAEMSTKGTDSAYPPRPKPMSYSERARVGPTSEKTQRTKTEIGGKTTATADQNTIPTVPETLSAISATSAFTPSISNVKTRDPGIARNTDSGSDESDVAQKEPDSPPQPVKGTSPSPPLPTLLNPCNNNSSSSSVASSLEAPHSREHGKNSRTCEGDVGFHLLGVCKRLSNDVSVFMKRRDEALAVRRRERRLVLNALEDSLGTLWPGMSSVEMYGSCATDLDLPSSDLDVVVCGLDRPRPRTNEPSPSKSQTGIPDSRGAPAAKSTNKKSEAMPRVSSQPVFSHYGPDSQQYSPNKHNIPIVHGHMYGHMSLNAERVVRLSMELERQPWAVHVKAIPTATVPVIKILADPARLPGAPSKGSEDWFLQHTPIAGQTTTKAQSDAQSASIHDSQSSSQNAVAPFSTAGEAPPLWRGADVTNGLLNVDITFEGPEHGGIGSTKFSQRVVEEFASKSGLSPEETPEVQALMVLKELLAQRRLNEPFTGGLSSYALLLLVVSVLKEREIIREELDKVEMQRRDVASGGVNSALQATTEPKEGKADATTKKTGTQTLQKKKKKKKGHSHKIPIVHFSYLASNIETRQRIQDKLFDGGAEEDALFGRIDKSKHTKAYAGDDSDGGRQKCSDEIGPPPSKRAKIAPDEISLAPPGRNSPSKKSKTLPLALNDRKLDLELLQTLPVVVCVAMYRTNGVLERNVSTIGRVEGKTLWHFS
mmetsp:Transcript_59718/g.146462  ORF Transcript_59718/g.146462 Transcript_59718/m.146462 type:complete len:1639 (+) Transcript_59718:316-5232(+)